MKRMLVLIAAFFSLANVLSAQVQGVDGAVVDTAGIYSERADSLDAAVFVSRQEGTYLMKGKEIRTEVISAAGLCKMACCNLAESFENSASVTVGFSDAVTGARQIRLLGLSGVYTQMLDENRPVMRGLSAPFGLSYVPGQWLNSIQIAKGSGSVINGVESMTGQINMEHRKPTDEKPLFLNAALMSDSKVDFNVASSLQLNEDWSTVLLGHVSGNYDTHDMNGDSFIDDPKMLQLNFANRWLYYAPSGLQIRFGVRALQDNRLGGQMLHEDGKDVYYNKDTYKLLSDQPWGSDITNRSINGYFKLGVPLSEDQSHSIGFIADYNYQDLGSYFGATSYLADQHSAFMNFLYQNQTNEVHQYTLGFSGTFDRYNENFSRTVWTDRGENTAADKGITDLMNGGLFGEYTFKPNEEFTAILGLRQDFYQQNDGKVAGRFSPRATLKYAPNESVVIRANGGRGIRYSTPLIDNIGVFSTGKVFNGAYNEHLLEDAWTFGGNLTYYLPFGASSNTYISFDYFKTVFSQQMVVDYERTHNAIDFYALDGRRSYTDNYQLDFSVDPFERFNVTVTARYTDAKIELDGKGLVEKPMTSRFKGVVNLQYAARLNRWIFDFTASVNGSCRVYNFMENMNEDGTMTPAPKAGVARLYKNGRTPVYPMLFAQVTRRFKGVDVYVGAENLTNFTQPSPIISANNPSAPQFDASAIWGPLMGFKCHAGFRFTLWKKA